MRSARMVIGGLACALGVLGCRSRGPVDPDQAVAADLSMLCQRMQARNVSAWSQPGYFTERIQALTIRVDAGDRAARCELGQLMQRHIQGCRDTARHLQSKCE